MSTLTTISILPLIAVIARVGGLAIAAPVFGSASIPKLVRFAIVVTLGFSAWMMHAGEIVTAVTTTNIAIILVTELAIGAAIGFLMSLPLIAIQMGGSLMGQQLSIALPSMLDPTTGSESDELGRAFMLFAIVGFVVVGGVEQTYAAVLASFSHLPIATITQDSFVTITMGFMDTVFEFGLRVALPLIAILMLQTAALGMIARSMPQLNIFSIGLPLRILVGLLVLVAGLALVGQAISLWMPDMIGSVSEWVAGGQT